MKKNYFIIDGTGHRHAIIKAEAEHHAIEIYCKGLPHGINNIVLAVDAEEIEELQNNLNKLK